jgi:hypothetical protein
VFHDLKNVKIAEKSLQIFANFSHILCLNHIFLKVGRGSSGDLFKIWCFLNLHPLGYPKSVTNIFCTYFWVNKSLSMLWLLYLMRHGINIKSSQFLSSCSCRHFENNLVFANKKASFTADLIINTSQLICKTHFVVLIGFF